MLNNSQVILLVEDDENDVLLLQSAFEKAKLRAELKVVHNGQQVKDYLSGHGAFADRGRFPIPFLLLLDLRMPGTDGFQVLRWVRTQPELKCLLVVVLTSSNLQRDIDRAYELGANSYLVKPSNLDGLMLMARTLIGWLRLGHFAPVSGPDGAAEASSAGLFGAAGQALLRREA